MNKAYQCNDAVNTPIAMAIDGTSAKEYKAAPIKGNQSGVNNKPTSNGGK
jgi:hypothetical protein